MEKHDERRVAERCGCGLVGCPLFVVAPDRMAPPGSGLEGVGHDVRFLARRHIEAQRIEALRRAWETTRG